jgi:hypothetical protein
MVRHSIDELAIQKTLKLSNDLEVDVMDDGSAVMKTKRGTVNLSPKNYKILRRSIKQGKLESVNEAKREIGGYYLMKQLKDLAQDAKRGGERKVHKALMYLHDRINQSYRDIDLNPRDVQDIFNDPRGRKYSKDMPDWMIDSLFEGKKMNEAKLKDIVPDIISAARPYTHHTLDHIARRSWDSSDDLIKKIQDYISYPKLRTRFKRDVKKLLKQHSIRENESINEAKKKVPVEKLSVGNTYKDSRGYPVKIVDINGGGNSWKITYKDSHGKKKIIKTSLRKGVNLYESINEAGMFDDYHKLNRAYMDDFIKNYKKLNRKNVVKKKGDDIYGFRKGEREAHWKYDDNFKLHYDIDKAKVLGLINFFNRAKKDHPWS